MTRSLPSPPRRPTPLLGEVELGPVAARVLVNELARDAGPKTGLVLAATADSLVVAAAIDALLPGDRLTLVPLAAAGEELRAHIAAQGVWVAERVRVAEPADEIEPADAVIVAQPLMGTAEAARGYLAEAAKYLADGGVLIAAALAGPGLADGATRELDRQAVLTGAGSDLVLRNLPPVRVHRLRYGPANVATAGRVGPAYRPSSIPLFGSMNIDSNGVAVAGIALGLAAAARAGRPRSRLWLLPALAAAPLAAFFRDPSRPLPDDPAAIVAASDGKVMAVERIRDSRLGADEYLRIVVFLSVLDVHVNRAPVAGTVVDHFVTDGGFAAAMKPGAEHNVSAYTVLDTAHGRVVVAQRTGLLARRIVQRAPVGAVLARGERFGLIRFGSRTDVYLPVRGARAEVGPGETVRGGASVIARWS